MEDLTPTPLVKTPQGATRSDPIMEEFRRRTPGSLAEWRAASLVLPLGVSSNFRYSEPYPLALARGAGCHLWDVDGNEYIDYNLAQGVMIMGYGHPEIVRAVSEATAGGSIYCLPCPEERRLAGLLIDRFPIDLVRFTNTGSESVMYAVRLARAFTKRSRIVRFEGAYHGSHDAVLASYRPRMEHAGPIEAPLPDSPSEGLIPGACDGTLIATYNDIDSVRRHFRENGGAIAAVVIEPIGLNYGVCAPVDGFIEEIRRLCDEHDALLIFDEVKTGVKVAFGGACELLGIRPDIVCLAKSIGGGLPLGAFGARREIMNLISNEEVLHSGTFNGNPVSVAAGIATLKTILTRETYAQLDAVSIRLAQGFEEVIERRGLRAHISRVGPHGTLWFGPAPIRNYRDFLRCDYDLWLRFYYAMSNRGVLFGPPGQDDQWTISVAHTEREIEATIRAFDEVAPSL